MDHASRRICGSPPRREPGPVQEAVCSSDDACRARTQARGNAQAQAPQHESPTVPEQQPAHKVNAVARTPNAPRNIATATSFDQRRGDQERERDAQRDAALDEPDEERD